MTTGSEIITDAFISIGKHDPRQTIDATILAFGLRVLNRLLSSWSNILIPYTISESFSLDGSLSYTMGTGGTASDTRARRITSAYVSDGTLDYPMDIIDRVKYNNIHNKSLGGRPDRLFYDPVYPVGVIYVWKDGGSDYTVHIESEKILDSLAKTTTDFTLDPIYELAIFLNLRNILAKPGFVVTNDMILEADQALTAIKTLNAANRLEAAEMPPMFQNTTYNPKTIEDG